MENDERDDGHKRTERRRGLVVLVSLAGVALVAVAVIFFAPGPSQPGPSDSGSGPDGEPTRYTAISRAVDPAPTGAIANRARDGGPLHRDTGAIWLGSTIGADSDDAVALPGFSEEGGFASVRAPDALIPCAQNRLVVIVSTGRTSPAERSRIAYLNIFADWNRDGRFWGSDGCAEEWVLRNHEIPLSGLKGDTSAVGVSIPAGEQTMEFWLRATITLDEPADGPRPEHPYRTGETEDVLVGPIPSDSDSYGSRSGCLGSLPPAILGGGSAAVDAQPPGGGVSGERGGAAVDVSAAFDTPTDSPVVTQRDPASGMLILGPPQVPAPRYGNATTGWGRCRFVVLANFPDEPATPIETLQPRQELLVEGAASRERSSLVPYCVGSRVFSGGEAVLPIHRFPARSQAHPADDSPTVSISMWDADATPSAGAETTPTQLPGPRPAVSGLVDGGGSIRAMAVRIPPEIGNKRYKVEMRSGSGTSVLASCTITVTGPPPRPPREEGPKGERIAGIPRLGGDYDVTFSKKSDSCGIFELRSVEWLRIRQYGERIEVQREAGNLSSGQITYPSSFRATGSGQDRGGTAYIESYSARIVSDGFAGSYDLQREGCRASFDIEGTRR